MDILRFKEFVELSEQSKKLDYNKIQGKLIGKRKNKTKLGIHNGQESNVAVLHNPEMDTGNDDKNLITFYI